MSANFFMMMAAGAKKVVPDFTIDLVITDSNLTFGVQPSWNAGGWCNIADWGDGQSQAATTSGTQITHTYAAAGSYRVKVRGDMYRFRVGSTNPGAVIDCNGNWDALGNITDGSQMFYDLTNALCVFTSLPAGLTTGTAMFNGASQMRMNLAMLPPGLTGMGFMFTNCRLSTFDLDAIADNNPEGWPAVTGLNYIFQNVGYGNVPGTCTGSIAHFMRRLPGVNIVSGAFIYTNTTTFGTDDYFEITLTTTEANQAWGFTATSSAGRWYCFDWGDGTAVTASKNLDVFTSGTKVSHTFATPGTYHIKLATAPCAIKFDPYDSDNGNYAALGWPLDSVAGVFLKEGATVISSGMTMTGATVSSGQSQTVYDQGVANSAVVESGGYLYVSSGGAASNCRTEATGATVNIYAGGRGVGVNAPSGGIIGIYGDLSGGTAGGGGYYVARSGGVLSGIVLSSGGSVFGYGGAVSGATVHSAARLRMVSQGSFANDIAIERAGYLYVSAGCNASAVNVASAANLIVESGGTALAVTSNAGAAVTVREGGYIEYVN